MAGQNALAEYIDVVSRFDARGLEDAERKMVAMSERVKRLQTTIGPAVNQKADDRLIREAIRNSDRLAKESEKVGRRVGDASDRAVRLGTAIATAHVAARGLAVVADGIEWKKAFDSGDLEKAQVAAEKLKKTLSELPVVGGAAQSMSSLINNTNKFPFLKSVRDAVARKFGNQTDDEMRATDEEEAKRRADFSKGKTRENLENAFAASDSKIVEDLKKESELEGKSAAERAAILAARRVTAFDEETVERNKVTGDMAGSPLRPERAAARQALNDEAAAAEFNAAADRTRAQNAAWESAEKIASDTAHKMQVDFFDSEKAAARDELDNMARDRDRTAELTSETGERDLMTAGRPGAAVASRIERELTAALSDAGGNPELRAALVEDAQSQLRALIPETARATMAAVVRDPNLTDVRRGSEDPSRETNDILKNGIQKAIERTNELLKNPPPARTS